LRRDFDIAITAEDLDYYVAQYEQNGFRGPLNWYRNIESYEGSTDGATSPSRNFGEAFFRMN
jgi:hypothetical protein